MYSLLLLVDTDDTKYIVEQAPKSSIWALSSDSEPGPDSSLLMEEKKFQFQEKGRVEDATLIGREGKNVIKKASKEKSPKKGLNSPKKEKDINNNVKRKGTKFPLTDYSGLRRWMKLNKILATFESSLQRDHFPFFKMKKVLYLKSHAFSI